MRHNINVSRYTCVPKIYMCAYDAQNKCLKMHMCAKRQSISLCVFSLSLSIVSFLCVCIARTHALSVSLSRTHTLRVRACVRARTRVRVCAHARLSLSLPPSLPPSLHPLRSQINTTIRARIVVLVCERR